MLPNPQKLQTETLFQSIKTWRKVEKKPVGVSANLQAVNPLCVTICLNGVFDIIEDKQHSTEDNKTYILTRGKAVLGCLKFQF